ncbi:heavy-metal-associated domain-containing protein [Billgrantia antri]|uniref:Heavy-metal-associated domain-containing protein n=1 Tax=Billgrantia antri TaxID=2846777 RepID=A0ABS6ZHW6_9GAMM|nr:heavy-metal-associated domain-containing protein [Halomonas antri]MBW6389656.1 heavy-metal-associated domain-containing protein [Halomonas antri]
MLTLRIPDMSCNHCVSAISAAVKSVDNDASLEFDLAQRQVKVDSTAEDEAIRTAIEDAGYASEAA